MNLKELPKHAQALICSLFFFFLSHTAIAQSDNVHVLLANETAPSTINLAKFKENPGLTTDSKKMKLQTFSLYCYANASTSKKYENISSLNPEMIAEIAAMVEKFPAGIWMSFYDIHAGKGKKMMSLESFNTRLTKL